MSNTKQAIKDHCVTNREILDDLIKEIDSKLEIFDDMVDSQDTTNQHETSTVEAE